MTRREASSKRPRKASRFLLLTALIASVAACALGVYLQTADAFSRWIVPCFDLLSGTRTTVGRGRITWGGSFEVDGLRWRDRARGLSLSIERARLRFDPASLVLGERPRVRALRIEGAALSIEPGDGAADDPNGAENPPGFEYEIALPVAIEDLDATDLSLRIERKDEPSLVVRQGRLTVRELVAEGSAKVHAHAVVDAAPHGAANYSGTLSADFDLRQRNGFLRGAAGSFGIDLDRLGATAPDHLRLAATVEADLEETGADPPRPPSGLNVERLDARLEKSGRPLIEVELAAPLRLDLRPGAGAAAPGRAEASLVARTDVDLAELDRWVKAAGGAGFGAWARGKLRADLEAKVAGGGRRIEVAGDTRLFDLNVPRGNGAARLARLELTAKVRGALDSLRHLDVAAAELRLAEAQRTQARVHAHGRVDLASGETDTTLQIEIPHLAEAWRLLPPAVPALPLAGAGRLTGEQKIARAGEDAPVHVSGHADLDDVRLTGGDAGSVAHRWELRSEVQVHPGGAPPRLDAFVLHLFGRGGERRGSIEASGPLPLGSAGAGERLAIAVRGLDGAAWLRLAGVEPPAAQGLEVEAELTVGRNAGGELAIEGSERAHLPAAPGRDGLRLEAHSRASFGGDAPPRLDFDLLAGREVPAHPEIEAHGTWAFAAERSPLRVAATLRGADTRTFAPLWPARDRAAQAEAGPSGDAAFPLDFDVDLELRAVRHGEMTVERGRIEARGDADGVVVVIAPTSVAGGTLEGRVERKRRAGGTSHSLDVQAARVDLQPFVRTLAPEDRHEIRGRLDLEASVRGEGDLGKSAAGSIIAAVRDGHVTRLDLLQFMSRELKLRGLEVLDFDQLDAELELAGGVAHVRRGELRSKTVRLFVAGTVAADGHLDLRVQPRLGPELVPERSRLPFATAIARTVDGLLALPVEVTIKGKWSDRRYAIRPAAPGLLTAPGQAVGKTVTGVVGTVEGAAGAVGRLLRKPKSTPRRP